MHRRALEWLDHIQTYVCCGTTTWTIYVISTAEKSLLNGFRDVATNGTQWPFEPLALRTKNWLINFTVFIHIDVKHLQRYAQQNVSCFVIVKIGRRLEIVNGHYLPFCYSMTRHHPWAMWRVALIIYYFTILKQIMLY